MLGPSLMLTDPSGLSRSQQQVLGVSGAHRTRSLWALSPHLPGEQVLLSLSDEDLELGLGVCSSLHRRKLRLAIEDYRDAEAGRRWVGMPGHPTQLGLQGEGTKVYPETPRSHSGGQTGTVDWARDRGWWGIPRGLGGGQVLPSPALGQASP